jgi:transposase InsO family protein
VYAAVVLDLFSRRVVGWAVGPSLETELPLAALEQALSRRRPRAGLIHHSDQGTQYASNKYVEKLRENGVKISMSRKGNPYDNAFAESFIKTLKTEEVDCNEYATLAEAQVEIGGFIEGVYNPKRLHSALGYVTPVEYEEALPAPTTAA